MNLVVLGGGTAGWLSALFLRKTSPESNVSVIYSSKIGTIGVGEATVPPFIDFLESIGITAFDIIKNCGGTVKHGISFENWRGASDRYLHPFSESLTEFSVPNVFGFGCTDFYIKNLINQGRPVDSYMYANSLAYENKVDSENVRYALHFDAALLAGYLEKVGKERGIKCIDATMRHAELDENGYVTKLRLSNDSEVDADFIVDASGSSRALVGGIYKKKWVDKTDELPMSRALPFWLEEEAETRPYTRSIAMSSGWMWQIPVEGRVGAGYVFDDDYLTPDQAVEELESFLGRKIDVRKDISFRAGESEDFWVKNVMSIGLSAAFVEPLESTSIWLTTQQMTFFLQFFSECSRPSEGSLRIFNRTMRDTMEVIRSFIYIHYLGGRDDSDFWRGFRDKTRIPDMLSEILEDLRMGDLRWTSFDRGLCRFDMSSYLHVIAGLNISQSLPSYDSIRPSPEEYRKEINYRIIHAQKHNDLLNEIRSM